MSAALQSYVDDPLAAKNAYRASLASLPGFTHAASHVGNPGCVFFDGFQNLAGASVSARDREQRCLREAAEKAILAQFAAAGTEVEGDAPKMHYLDEREWLEAGLPDRSKRASAPVVGHTAPPPVHAAAVSSVVADHGPVKISVDELPHEQASDAADTTRDDRYA